jgi:hypothetical protein
LPSLLKGACSTVAVMTVASTRVPGSGIVVRWVQNFDAMPERVKIQAVLSPV